MICYVQIKPPGMQARNNTDIDEELLTQIWDVGSRADRLKFCFLSDFGHFGANDGKVDCFLISRLLFYISTLP